MYHCAVLRKFEGHVACSALLCGSFVQEKGQRLSVPAVSLPTCPLASISSERMEEPDLNHLLAYGSKLGCKSLEQVTLSSLAGSQNLSCLFKSTGPQTRHFMTVSSS